MNLVAHQFLSFGNASLQIGNLLAEEIKGKRYELFPKEIQTGILLHRYIDSFMDSHPTVIKGGRRLYPYYSKYAFVVMDIYYDYLLIKNWNTFHDKSFAEFSIDCYALFEKNINLFSPSLQQVVYKIKEHDWYSRYTSIEGLKEVFYLQNKRIKKPYTIEGAEKKLIEFEKEFHAEFLQFFPEICVYTKNFIKNNLS